MSFGNTGRDWPVLSLLRTVLESIFEVALLCVAGYLLARQGILDKKTQKHVNRINVSLFTPSLLFSKVAFSLTPEKLRELWIIPIVFVVTTICSMLVAYVFGSVLRLKRSQRSFAMAASMFMNSNSLPVALMQSMVYSVNMLRWGDDDTKDAMLARALTYLVLYSTFGMVVRHNSHDSNYSSKRILHQLRWSYGVHLLSQADEEVAPQPKPVLPQEPDESTALLQATARGPGYLSTHSHSVPDLILTHDGNSSRSSSGATSPHRSCIPIRAASTPLVQTLGPCQPPAGHAERIQPKDFSSFPTTPIYPRSETSGSDDDYLGSDDGENQLLPSTTHTPPPPPLARRVWRCCLRVCRQVNGFMTAPMWAALLSLLVACIPSLQHTMTEHVQPIKSALNSAGNCSIPLTLVVLGAYFFVPQTEEERERALAAQKGRTLKTRVSHTSLVGYVRNFFVGEGGGDECRQEARPGETRTVVVAVMSRMILTPMILLPLLTVMMATKVVNVFDDPVFALTNVLLITSAPALTLAQITQAACGDAFERLISRTIFWAYCVVTPVSTIVSVLIGLLLTEL
ncbi:auxin efflux carrier [Hysterangium stoloniferum]|nr:auxin efflux carrier [Hysterangium stoloniferum]